MEPYIITWCNYDEVVNTFPKLRLEPVLKNSPVYLPCLHNENHINALKNELIKKEYIIYGDSHTSSSHTCIPIFNDGYFLAGVEEWSNIMAEVMNDINATNYTAEDFMIAKRGKINENLPG